jgi:hypothetical protein
MIKEKFKKSLTGGFEPPTFRLTAERSTELREQHNSLYIKEHINGGFVRLIDLALKYPS